MKALNFLDLYGVRKGRRDERKRKEKRVGRRKRKKKEGRNDK